MSTVRALRWFARGRCLVECEDSHETFLVARIAPGERARIARPLRGGRRWPVAVEILEPSSARVAPICDRFDRCPGCDLLHVSPEEEARYKALTVSEILSRFADLEIPIDAIANVGDTERGDHRARGRLTVFACDDGPRIGFAGIDGEPLDLTTCPAFTPKVRAALVVARGWLRDWAAHLPLAVIEVREGDDGVALVLEREAPGSPGVNDPHELPTGAIEALVASVTASGLGSIAVGLRRGADAPAELLAGRWPRQPAIGDVRLEAAVDAWVQPVPSRAAQLYEWVLALGAHRGASVLDATAGTGGLSVAMAREATSVLAADANWDALQSLDASAAALGLSNITTRGGKVQTLAPRLARSGVAFDLVVVNPMRVSLGDDCMRELGGLARHHLLYLAPAPRAGAADVRALLDRFEVRQVAAVTLHPGTAATMMAVLLDRRDDTN